MDCAETLKNYYNEPVEHEAKSIVAGSTFMQYLNKLFKTQIATEIYYSLSLINIINSPCFLDWHMGRDNQATMTKPKFLIVTLNTPYRRLKTNVTSAHF